MEHMKKGSVRWDGVSPASSLSSAEIYEVEKELPPITKSYGGKSFRTKSAPIIRNTPPSPDGSYSPKFSPLSNQGNIEYEKEPPLDVWNGLKTKPGVEYTKNSPDPSYLSTKDLEKHPKTKEVIPIDQIGPGRLEILPDKKGGYAFGPSYSPNDMNFSPLSHVPSPHTPSLSQNPPLPMLAANGLDRYSTTPGIPKSNLRNVVNNDEQDNAFLTQLNTNLDRSVSEPVVEDVKILSIIPKVENRPNAIAPLKHSDLKRDTGTKFKLPAIIRTLKK